MGTEERTANNISYYICEAIMVILMFSGFFIHGGALPDYGWQVLFIFFGLMFGWSVVGLIIPSLLGIIALGFLEGNTVLSVWAEGFSDNIIALIILFGILAKWMERIGLSDSLINWFMRLKFLRGRPWVFIGCFLFIVYIIGFMVGAIPAILISWAFTYTICAHVGYEKRSPFCAFLVVNIACVAAQGGYCKPWGSWGLVALKAYQTVVPEGVIDYVTFIGWTSLVFLSADVLMLLLGKYILRIDTEKLRHFDFSSIASSNRKVTGVEKFAGILFIAMIILLFIPGYLPGGAIKQGLNTIGIVGTVLAILVIVGLARDQSGKDIFQFGQLAAMKGAIPWSAVMLLTATIPLGSALKSKDAGIMSIISGFAKTHMLGMSDFVFYCIIAVFMGLLTQVAHNVVLMVSVSPIFVTIAGSIGASGEVVILIATVVLGAALGTPAASTRAAMVFGNTEYVGLKDAYLYGWVTFLAMLITTLFIGVPVAVALL